MDILIKVIFNIIVVGYMAITIKHVLHMFQQNRYELLRYIAWLKKRNFDHQDLLLMIILTMLFFIPLLIINRTYTMVYIAIVVILKVMIEYRIENKKEYIKPLVWTSRVKRLVFTMLVLNIIWLNIFILLPFNIWSLALIIATIINWFLIILAYYINQPFEYLVKQYFINDAKRILKGFDRLHIIGITGSYGKTSTKNILDSVLSESYYTLKTPLSYNTPMGITITIREHLKALHEVFICEMGADKVNEIDFLTKFVKPKYGIVTSIGPQHLNTFLTMENIIHEKMLMIENLPQDGIGFINLDNHYIRNYHIKNNCRLITYGIKSTDVDYNGFDISYNNNGSTFFVKAGADIKAFKTKLLGEHNIANILVTIAVGRTMGISWEKLQQAILNLDYVEHRLQLKKINGLTFIDNAFNSNPEGAAMSLTVLSRMANKRFIITPGMIDLGSRQDEANREFGRQMLNKVDQVILVGKKQTAMILDGLYEVGFDKDAINVVDSVKEAFALVYQMANVEDTILLENDLPDAFNN
ncbi:MAG: UDP-N-acetylmuramoyl-tripeptide--D-alanyl-D-alanine ligase [Erysipelotrichaceae bacterium]|nr:UDP-N-acetylmuramoyl-tripeptide--D-alanyl-D-alanine ligase [Erysipelotrichaceae bacterium]